MEYELATNGKCRLRITKSGREFVTGDDGVEREVVNGGVVLAIADYLRSRPLETTERVLATGGAIELAAIAIGAYLRSVEAPG